MASTVIFYVSTPFSGSASATSNALYLQQVTVSYSNRAGTHATTFTGSGEGIPMKMSNGEENWQIDTSFSPIQAYFQYSTDGGQTWNDSNADGPVYGEQEDTAGAEDGNDGDYNDTVLTISF